MPAARPDVHAGLPERDPRANAHAAPGAPGLVRPARRHRGLRRHARRGGRDVDITEREITAFIGPSGCGKSTLIRCLNRMNDLIPGASVSGEVLFQGQDLYAKDIDPVQVRKVIGMVFQKPNRPQVRSTNIAFGRACSG
jgi:ABC-type multidrug transport system fused ATPase/permease subunit